MARICAVEGCLKPSKTRNWCGAHYERWRQYGDPLGLKPRASAEERLWRRVDRNGPDGCWVWLGRTDLKEYGRLTAPNGERIMAHRFAYELLVGPIPEGLQIDHLCRNTRCVNPAHLEPVTNAENQRRGFAPPGLFARRTHCSYGHEYTAENTYVRPSRPGTRVCRICLSRRATSYRLSRAV